ncbi:MAG: CRTAC1 family protein [Acidobacteria bacterium]|nr:CRTAC1 family protein [Acidobacteriota bacterium]
MLSQYASPQPADPIRFTERADALGLRFTLAHHPTPEKRMIETMPGGVATLDYDGDGFTDIFFTNGAEVPSLTKTSPTDHNRLFRNEAGRRFRDVTSETGLQGAGYSMGAAVADFDNDGRPDIFVAGVNRNILYRNTASGFLDVTARYGIASNEWAVAAAFSDFDNDGFADLLVVNYSSWPQAEERFCGDSARKLRVYCHPKYFREVPNRLYRNLRGQRFEDVTASSGIGAARGRGMSAAIADYDTDNRADIFVTNDNLPNFLFRNVSPRPGQIRFEETALLANTALLDHGKPVASMGADFRDYDNDGLPDIALTALSGETFPLFRNLGGGMFKDNTYASRIGPLTAQRAGWGIGWIDFDNDGHKDLFTANSHVNDIVEQFESFPYRQPNTVLRNLGNGAFADASASLARPAPHRGAAFADFNNDGRIDIVVTALGEPAELWINESPAPNHWVIVRPTAIQANRDALGARIVLDGQTNHMTTAVSYASSSHYGVHFGLGASKKIAKLQVFWPSGVTTILEDQPANRVISIAEPQ